MACRASVGSSEGRISLWCFGINLNFGSYKLDVCVEIGLLPRALLQPSQVIPSYGTVWKSPSLSAFPAGLLAWAQKQGIDMSKAPFTVTPKEGTLTLVAARDIAAGETVLAVPSSAWLTPEAADKSRVGQYVKNCEGWVKLCVYLMAERAAGPSSPLSAYLSAAPGPEGHPSPLFWTEAELAEIKGTQLMDKVQGYRAFLTVSFKERLALAGGSLSPVRSMFVLRFTSTGMHYDRHDSTFRSCIHAFLLKKYVCFSNSFII